MGVDVGPCETSRARLRKHAADTVVLPYVLYSMVREARETPRGGLRFLFTCSRCKCREWFVRR